MGSITCICCGESAPSRGPKVFCGECSMLQLNECWRAQKRVQTAIRAGFLLPAVGCACVDCGRPAVAYDHRDYTRPLDVDPVCARCNKRRGPALNSRMRDFPGYLSRDAADTPAEA